MCHSPRSSELNHDDPSSFSPPAAFGPFRVLHQIGSGVLGPVFRTYEPERDRLIAVKAFRIDLLPEQSAQLATELQHIVDAGLTHSGIVQPLAAGMEGHLPYLAQEYVAAESLDIAMKHYAPAPPARVMPFLRELAGAIDTAAAAGVFHGALHPRDIFVTTDEARATGFGIVQAIENIGFRAPTRRPYTAPERVDGDEWGPAADVFSLGAIAHELLTGRRPAGPGDQDGSFAADVPAEHRARIRDVLASALAEDPAARFPSATAFVDALDAASEGRRADLPAAAPKAAVPAAAATTATAATVAAAPSLFDNEDTDVDDRSSAAGEPVETVAEVEDTEDVEDTTDVEDADDVEDTTDVEEPQEPEEPAEPEEPGTEPEEPMEPGEPAEPEVPDVWPPKGFATDDLDIVAERETDEALADFDLDLDRTEPAYTAAAPEIVPESPSSLDAAALDYETGAEEDEDARRYDAERLAAIPPPSSPPRPEAWTPATPTAQAQPQADPRQKFIWTAGTLAIGILLGWAIFGRGDAPDPAADQPAGQSATTPTGPAPVTEEPVKPPPSAPSAPSTPAPAATPAAPTRGSVLVRSTPGNAAVIIDRVWTGRTPLTKRDLPFGQHTVRVVLEGYAPINRRVTLSRENPSREMTFELTRTPGGRAPATAAPPAGTPESEVAPPPGTPAPAAIGTLSISSRPAGARVLVDGRFVGTTPMKLAGVSVGAHRITIELDGYRVYARTVAVTRNREARVAASLQPR